MTDQLGALTTIFTEFYYWVTVVLMFLIHVGFCMYEVGASRYKHHQHTLMKNTMLIPLVTVTWFFFGWWIYWAFPTGSCWKCPVYPPTKEKPRNRNQRYKHCVFHKSMLVMFVSRCPNLIHTKSYVDQKHKNYCYPIVKLCKYSCEST